MAIRTVCPRCRTTQAADAADADERAICVECGATFVATPIDDPPRSRRGRYDDEDDHWDDRPRRRRRDPAGGYASTSLALGIVSCVVFLCPPVGFCTSAVGVVAGYYGLKSRQRPLAVTGLVLSLVGMIFAVGFTVLYLSGMIQAVVHGPAK